jgi:hypothetical protein
MLYSSSAFSIVANFSFKKRLTLSQHAPPIGKSKHYHTSLSQYSHSDIFYTFMVEKKLYLAMGGYTHE